MLSAEDNETIRRVGPGTPMGSLLREYWLPALLSTELPGPDCHPGRVAGVCKGILGALADHRRTGDAPPVVDHPELCRQRLGGRVLPAGVDRLEATRGLRERIEQPTIDPRLSAGV